MTSSRVPTGGSIDRSQTFTFTFDGHVISGHPGDTIASALLANGVQIVGRSFKYHRPRGIWGAWTEEPNAIFDVVEGGVRTPNARATTALARGGMVVQSVNTHPTAANDRYRFLDRFSRFIPAAFYYKTFMWPHWHKYEPKIRNMAGLGHADPEFVPTQHARKRFADCDLLVVGAGPAGLACAVAAASRGEMVFLVDDHTEPGGALLDTGEMIDGQSGTAWAGEMLKKFQTAGGRFLSAATAFGVYDHKLVGVSQLATAGDRDCLWRIRAKSIVVAAGAIERPLTFPDNDRPGIMSAHAARNYLCRYAVRAGENIAIASNNSSTAGISERFVAVGAKVTLINLQSGTQRGSPEIEGVDWRNGLKAVRVGGRSPMPCDALLVSGGWTPTVHLHCQAGGKLDWCDDRLACVPRKGTNGITTIGAANGTFDTGVAIEEGTAVGEGRPPSPGNTYSITAAWPRPGGKGRQWIDFQNDVTVRDIELAARENYRSVEHLKRYTTLGMATDQGKTSNIAGLATMAAIGGRTIPEVGTTTYRPPFVPVLLTTIAGARRGPRFAPVKQLVLENTHRDLGAVFREYGGWLRPAYYGDGPAHDAIQNEAKIARQTVGLFDGTPLGKIEVFGPDAETFLNFIYYNTISTLAPGRIRYGFMLTEAGVVYDDGVLMRLSDNHFIVSCSSSHVAGVAQKLDIWRQDLFDPACVFIQDSTPQWATLTVTGPRSKSLLDALDLGINIDDTVLPHMSFAARDGLRICRVSFSGDRSYEISVPAGRAGRLWDLLINAGAKFDALPIGLEAMSLMRAEKGLIIVGKDTDGSTMPHDLGFDIPRNKKTAEYVGKRGLFTEVATGAGRLELVGLTNDGEPLKTGAHVLDSARSGRTSGGFVTSSYFSPNLGRPIAMALVRSGRKRLGDTVEVFQLGETRNAVISPVCALDEKWERLNG